MIDAISTGMTNVISWFGSVVTSLFGSSGALKDLLPAIGIAVALFIVTAGVRLIKNIIKGY